MEQKLHIRKKSPSRTGSTEGLGDMYYLQAIVGIVRQVNLAFSQLLAGGQ